MKKMMILLFVMASMIFVVPPAEAKTMNAAEPAFDESQRRDRTQRRDRRQRVRRDRRHNRDDRYRDRRDRRNRRYDRRYDNRRRARTVYRTGYVRRGRWIYRETYRVTYYPSGRVKSKRISRVKVRRYYR